MQNVSLLWQIPLSVCSWLFFHVVKFILGRLYTYSQARAGGDALQWKTLSRESIAPPLALPIVATKGPRWNTHAVVITVGPVDVKSHLSFRVATASASASSWSIVLYGNPRWETVATIESFDVPGGKEWRELRLAPGKYSINTRYYGLSDPAFAPEVEADGAAAITRLRVPPGTNDFYRDLLARNTPLYAALHYYVFHMLRLRKWLAPAFVFREFLPVGDPGNVFRFGCIRAGQVLEVECHEILFENYDVYLTIYNRSSFPVAWCQLRELSFRGQPAPADGFYLFRVRRKGTITAEFREDWMTVRLPARASRLKFEDLAS